MFLKLSVNFLCGMARLMRPIPTSKSEESRMSFYEQ